MGKDKDQMIREAIIDESGKYRYSLYRSWNIDLPPSVKVVRKEHL